MMNNNNNEQTKICPKTTTWFSKKIKGIIEMDDTLASYICALVSSLPISLIFTVTALGTTVLEHIFFTLMLLAIAVSIVLSISAIKFTVLKIHINQLLQQHKDLASAEEAFWEKQYDEQGKRIIAYLVVISLASLALLLVTIGLWCIKIFIG